MAQVGFEQDYQAVDIIDLLVAGGWFLLHGII
jgi:hypothetical protein